MSRVTQSDCVMPTQRPRYLIDDMRGDNPVVQKDRAPGPSSVNFKNRRAVQASGQASTKDPAAGASLTTDSYLGSEDHPKVTLTLSCVTEPIDSVMHRATP